MIFLRPWALLLLVIPFLLKGIHRLTPVQTPWNKYIDKALLPALLVKGKIEAVKKLWSWQMMLLWGLWSIALAGPAFNKLPTPAVESAPNTVIVFDLAMKGKNLLKGQAKLYDLLSALHGERVGLVVFGNTQGYTAMPLTPDIGLLKEIVSTLTPEVLPEVATNPTVGFEYAAKLLDNAGAKGRILYITDKEQNWYGRYPFGILNLKERTADTSDIQALLNKTKKAESSSIDTTFSTQADVWADLGGWIVAFSLPFFSLMFRKGILFLILILVGLQAEAGFFQRPDQKLYTIETKGVEAYNKKEYQTATELFKESGNLYNLGNALAFSGDIQGAIDAYTKELEKNPKNQDAKFNKEYLEKQMTPPENQDKRNKDEKSQEDKNKSDQNQDKSDNDSQQDKKAQDKEIQDTSKTNLEQNQEQKNKSEPEVKQEGQSDSDKNSSKSEEQQTQEKGNQPNAEQPTQDETQRELEKALAEYDKENKFNQEEQQVINRLNHDPSRVLRYRLMLQHQKGQTR